ncbi:hypothetical protein P8452_71428 [Trifolium repens]|nr:hypothetical protein P8452_71428 [Trifolium repens]
MFTTYSMAMADLTSIKTQNSVNSSPFQTSEKNFREERNENRATYLAPAPERFRSRWLGGWTSKPASASSLRRHVAASLMQHHRAIEINNHALQPLSPATYGSSMEVSIEPAPNPSFTLLIFS